MKVSLPASFVAELEQRAETARQRERVLELLRKHPKQYEALQNRQRNYADLCSRRAGKSYKKGAKLILGGLDKPGGLSVYVCRSKGDARRILEPALVYFNLNAALGMYSVERDGQLYWFLPNRHCIWLAGCNDRSEVGKFRGPKYCNAEVDECQEFEDDVLRELVTDVLRKALVDEQGDLGLGGTPGPAETGFFWEVTTGQGEQPQWPTNHWTIFDNPFIPHAEAEYQLERKLFGWDKWEADNPGKIHPRALREWFGQWATDLAELVYPFSRVVNGWSPNPTDVRPDNPWALPGRPSDYRFGLGVDVGFSEHSMAFALLANHTTQARTYILKAYTQSRMIPTDLATHCRRLREQLEALGMALRIVVDEGALGVGYAAQMQANGVGCEAAVKHEKRAYQDWVAGLIRSGVLLMRYSECPELAGEASRLQFDPETGKEKKGQPNHCCDAMLYIVRAMVPRYDPQEVPPPPGSPEAIRREMAAHKQKLVAEREKRNRRR